MVRRKTPVTGSAYAFPLGDGRFGVCRVLLDSSSQRSKEQGAPWILAACSSWIGDEVPHAEEQESVLRPILRLTHHSWNDLPQVLWVRGRLPQDFIPIGIIEPTAKEQETPCYSYASWETLTMESLTQWRWDNDRGALLAEEEQKWNEELEAQEKAEKLRRNYLRKISLENLQNRQFFPNWKRYPSSKAIRACRQLMTDTVQQLLSLGSNASENEKLAILKECIESFNLLDGQIKISTQTQVREDVFEEISAVVVACGVDFWRIPARLVKFDRRKRLPYRCPCCRCYTLEWRGAFECCPVCYWEDDGQDDHDADEVYGGPNFDLSLSMARKNYRIYGAVVERLNVYTRKPYPKEL